MATFYVGLRPVLRGRNSSEFINVFKGEAGTYSHYALFGPGLLTDAPDNDHVPGTGYAPGNLTLSRRFTGEDEGSPMDGAGNGVRISGMRFRPLENKAAGNALVFKSGYGRDVDWGYFLFDGVDASEALADAGHARRSSGGAASFGAFDPHAFKGVGDGALDGAGQEAADRVYGGERVNEWFGVTSAKAL